MDQSTTLVFRGKRFDFHTLPIDILPDILAFEKLIKHCAAKKYMEQHPQRERLPRGFKEQVSIGISKISPGSTEVGLSFTVYGQQHISLTDEEACYYQAVDEIINAIEVIEEGNSELPEEWAPFFDKFGRSLKEGEEVIIQSGRRKAEFNKARRHRILATTRKPFTDEIQLWGIVSNIDLEHDKIIVISSEGGVSLPVDIDMDIWSNYLIGQVSNKISQTKIYIEGIGNFSGVGKLLSIEEVKDIQLLDPLDIQARIEELSHLEDGWLDGTGKGILKDGAKRVAELFALCYEEKLPTPHIFPTEDGELQAEWSIGVSELILRVNLETLIGRVVAIDTENDSEKEYECNLSEKLSWDRINSSISEMVNGK
ncbi:MAG: hypothetical protein FWG96_07120 [Methanomassiliicoccaceae archaeon]|nr:hypothetical protein [Methanomassiliicoccaceae archaeon]